MKVTSIILTLLACMIFDSKILSRDSFRPKINSKISVPERRMDDRPLRKILGLDPKRTLYNWGHYKDELRETLIHLKETFGTCIEFIKTKNVPDQKFFDDLKVYYQTLLGSPGTDLEDITNEHLTTLKFSDFYLLDKNFQKKKTEGKLNMFFIYIMMSKITPDESIKCADLFNDVTYFFYLVFVESREKFKKYALPLQEDIDSKIEELTEESKNDNTKEQENIKKLKTLKDYKTDLEVEMEANANLVKAKDFKTFESFILKIGKAFSVVSTMIANRAMKPKLEPYRKSISLLVRMMSMEYVDESKSQFSGSCSGTLSNKKTDKEEYTKDNTYKFEYFVTAAHCFDLINESGEGDIKIKIYDKDGVGVEHEITLDRDYVLNNRIEYSKNPIAKNDFFYIKFEDFVENEVSIKPSQNFIVQNLLSNNDFTALISNSENGNLIACGYPGIGENYKNNYPPFIQKFDEMNEGALKLYVTEMFPMALISGYFTNIDNAQEVEPFEKLMGIDKEIELRKFGGHAFQGMSGGSLALIHFKKDKQSGQETFEFYPLGIISRGKPGLDTHCPFETFFTIDFDKLPDLNFEDDDLDDHDLVDQKVQNGDQNIIPPIPHFGDIQGSVEGPEKDNE